MCPAVRRCRHVSTDLLDGACISTSVLTRAIPCCGTCAISGCHVCFHLSFPGTKLLRSMCLLGHPLQLKSNLHQDQFCMSLIMFIPWLFRSFNLTIMRHVLAASVSRHLGHEQRKASQICVSFCASRRETDCRQCSCSTRRSVKLCSLFWCSVSRPVRRSRNLRRKLKRFLVGVAPILWTAGL